VKLNASAYSGRCAKNQSRHAANEGRRRSVPMPNLVVAIIGSSPTRERTRIGVRWPSGVEITSWKKPSDSSHSACSLAAVAMYAKCSRNLVAIDS